MREFQIADTVRTYYHGTQVADIYNDEEHLRSAGYRKTSDKDQYGYPIWENDSPDREYWKQPLAILLPIHWKGGEI